MRTRFGFRRTVWIVAGCVAAGAALNGTAPLATPRGAVVVAAPPPGAAVPVLTGNAPPTPPPAAGPPSPAFVPRTFTLLGAGDILLHPGLWRQGQADARARGHSGYDFDPLFASAVADISGADIAICHLETPLGTPSGPFTGFPTFKVPPQIARSIHDVGYDTCSTASNHSLDGGQAGVVRTLDALDAAGVKHTGTARSAREAATVDLIRLPNGVRVAQLSYAFGFNGAIRPADKPWLANRIDVKAILAAAHRAKQAGADVVVVSLHFGTEYRQSPNPQQLSVVRALLASPDVDLILGCHAHVVQPLQEINGKWVAYGMGNQVATQPFSKPTQDGLMVRFTFSETAPGKFRVSRAEAIPTFMYQGQDGGPTRLIDIPAELRKPGLSAARRALYVESWKRTAREVDAMGAAKDGLIVVGGALV
ncbi:MAG TPA: CapA family protein [Micromonosporaceae bacterium]|nr:CapA family protein [Micromonosporaceae bacterium]